MLIGGSWARDALLGGFLGFTSLGSPILGFWLIRQDIGQFNFPQLKPCKSVDYFIKVNFHVVVDREQWESSQSCLLRNYSYVFSWKSNDVSNARQKKLSKPFSRKYPKYQMYMYLIPKWQWLQYSLMFTLITQFKLEILLNSEDAIEPSRAK